MRCDVVKLRAARNRRAMTQEKLAAEARVDVRTVQRAEAGAPLRQETLADFAAVLGLPLSGLMDNSTERGGEPVTSGQIFGPGLVLRRAQTGREVIELLEGTTLAKLECDADPTDDIIDVLRDAIKFIEKKIPSPWDETEQSGPLSFRSLVDRLEHIAQMNKIISDLEKKGLSLFYGSTWEKAVMPRWGEEGLYVRTNQKPELVRATRLLIGQHSADKVTVQKATNWPVEIQDDDDEEIPF